MILIQKKKNSYGYILAYFHDDLVLNAPSQSDAGTGGDAAHHPHTSDRSLLLNHSLSHLSELNHSLVDFYRLLNNNHNNKKNVEALKLAAIDDEDGEFRPEKLNATLKTLDDTLRHLRDGNLTWNILKTKKK